MISLFLSKNKTRTTSSNELIQTVLQNRDLFYKEGLTTVGGITLYHFKNDNNDAILSYGSHCMKFEKLTKSFGRYQMSIGTLGTSGNVATMYFRDEVVSIPDKAQEYHDIPYSAFESDVDFFQYTLLNLQYGDISDVNLTKLVKFVQEMINAKAN